MSENGAVGRRFLVVEDEELIVAVLEDYLSDIGCSIALCAGTVREALRLVESGPDIDGAVLDMNLHGEAVGPVAAALASRGIPFCFMTGYGVGAADGYPGVPTLNKPFDAAAVADVISRLTSRPG